MGNIIAHPESRKIPIYLCLRKPSVFLFFVLFLFLFLFLRYNMLHVREDWLTVLHNSKNFTNHVAASQLLY